MDPLTLIVSALAAGAAAGFTASSQKATTSAMETAWRQIRIRVLRRAPDRSAAEEVLDRSDVDSEAYEQALRRILGDADAASDPEIVRLAKNIYKYDSTTSGKNSPNIQGPVQSLVIGDGSLSYNNFGRSWWRGLRRHRSSTT